MVSVKLTEKSQLGSRFLIEGLEGWTEITRNDTASVPLRRAIIGLSDSNLMFSFDEEDREGLLALPEKLLKAAAKELKKESLTAQELCDLLLPKPKALPKRKTTKKSALKAE